MTRPQMSRSIRRRLGTSLWVLVAMLIATAGPGVRPAAAQFGRVLDAAKRAADEAKKAQEAKRQAEEAKRKEQESQQPRPAVAPAGASSPSTAAAGAGAAATPDAASAPTFQAYSKFDFVPGEKVVAVEDFTQDAIGDFPARWNTNAAGEIVDARRPARTVVETHQGRILHSRVHHRAA